jgi:hypothetical protein
VRAAEIIDTITSAGGRIWMEEDKVRAGLPESLRALAAMIREHKPALMAELSRRLTTSPHDPAKWRESFANWWEFACVPHPRALAGLASLHRGFCQWQADGPPSVGIFTWLLAELDLLVREVAGTVLVSELIFKSDLAAHEQFQASAPNPPAKPRDTKKERDGR